MSDTNDWPKQVDRVTFALRPSSANMFFERPAWCERMKASQLLGSSDSNVIERLAAMHPYDIFRFLNACDDLVFLFEAVDGHTLIRRAGPDADTVLALVQWQLQRELLHETDSPLRAREASCPQQTHWAVETLARRLEKRKTLWFLLFWHVPGNPPRRHCSLDSSLDTVVPRVKKIVKAELGVTFHITPVFDPAKRPVKEPGLRDSEGRIRKPLPYPIPVPVSEATP